MRTVTGSTPGPSLRALLISLFSTFVAIAFVLITIGDSDAHRSRKKHKHYKKKHVSKRVKPNKKYAAYVIDAKTGKVLHAENANALRYPASLTKMMTLYLVFEELKRGSIKKSSRVVMTRNAAKRPPSKLGIRPGRSISVEQAILSLVTKSANDVSTAVGEKLSGSEAAFAARMTRKARQLGMKRTTFKNANGLPNRAQKTTAADMAKLGLALREHFPRQFRYFKTRSFKYGRRKYGNHNKLLGRVRGVDGIKTGYTRASGFNLVSSVSHGGRRIVAVVMGGRSGGRRNRAMTRLIKKYLPKASRGQGRLLIARAQPPRTPASKAPVRVASAASITLPTSAPSPTFSPNLRKIVEDRVTSSHNGKAIDQQTVALVTKQIKGLKKSGTPKPAVRTKVDKAVTASVRRPPAAIGGWQIQISASDSEKKASAMLRKARVKGESVLRHASNSTQLIKKNGTKLYRARFIGFSSQKAAEKACKVLKRKSFNCIALKG